jgi:hypothetical protein
MTYFGIDTGKLKLQDLEAETHYLDVQGTPSAVYVIKRKAGMPLPIGCSSILAPIDVRADDCWFVGLFRIPRPITRLEPKALFESIANFLPYLVKRRMTVLPLSLDSFHLDDGGGYQLAIPGCDLQYDAVQEDFVAFREELADLLPGNERLLHAMMSVSNIHRLPRHPANLLALRAR